jgi:hypothetical protein
MIYNIGQRPINKSLRLSNTAGRFEALSRNCQHKLLVSSCLSVCLSVRIKHSQLSLDRVSWNLILGCFSKMTGKLKFRWNPTRITGTLREDVGTFKIVSRWILLRMRYVSDKLYRKSKHINMFNNFFFFENRAVCETRWKNVVKLDGPLITI